MLAPRSSRESVKYSDIPKAMKANPISKDVARNTNLQAIKESLRNLIMTEKGERLFHPEIGCDIHSMLFDLMYPDTVITAKQMIKDTIEKYEPRVDLREVIVLTENNGTVSITLEFMAINISDPINFTIQIERVR